MAAKKKVKVKEITYPEWWSFRPPIIAGWDRIEPNEPIRARDKWVALNQIQLRTWDPQMDEVHVGHTMLEMWGKQGIYLTHWEEYKNVFGYRWYIYRRNPKWKRPIYLSPYFAVPAPLP